MKKESVKEVMYKGMVENFEKDGFLQPILFFVKDKTPVIVPIPPDILGTPDGKVRLVAMIKNVCTLPMVSAVGIVMEAYAKKFNNDDELGKLVMNGDIKIKDLKDKEDIIVMIFSTPKEEIIIGHFVDCENKTVGEKMKESDNISGMFSGFFNWNKN